MKLPFCVSSEQLQYLFVFHISWRARCLAPWAVRSRSSCSSSCMNCFGNKCGRRDDLPGLTTSLHFSLRQSVLPWLRSGWGSGLLAASCRYGVSARPRHEGLDGGDDRSRGLGAGESFLADGGGCRSD